MTATADELLDPAFLVRLERLDVNVRRLLAGERRGETSMNRRGAGTLFRGHRAYTHGDDPRFLDWNAYLRLGELAVKEFDAEETARVTVFLDASASMGTTTGEKFAQGQRLAAALGFICLARQGLVSVAPLPGGGTDAGCSGRGQVARFLDGLARLEPAGRTGYLRAFRAASPAGRRPGLAVVISDFLDLDEYRTGLTLLRRRHWQVEALHLVDPRELDPGIDGEVELADVETGRTLRETLNAEIRAAFRTEVDHHFADVLATCRGLGIGYHRLDVRESMEKLVLTVLRARAVVS